MSAGPTVTITTQATLVYTQKPFPWQATITARTNAAEGVVELVKTRSEIYCWRWTARLSVKRIQRSMRRELRRTLAGKNAAMSVTTSVPVRRTP